jgi:hypothetical protein
LSTSARHSCDARQSKEKLAPLIPHRDSEDKRRVIT